MRKGSWVVYWLHDDRCICLWRHGYIGVTNRLPQRMHQHRHGHVFRSHPDAHCTVVFEGTCDECLALEREMRPTDHIGWNIGFGGSLYGGGLRGIPKPPEQRAKQSAAALERYADPAQHKRTSRAVKKGLKNVDRSGPNNARFGKHLSEETKEKIRQRIAERGITGSNNPNYRHGHYSK
jgi:predicted GIY-YIG superfamily endonuclease